jgi:hypothetical protein
MHMSVCPAAQCIRAAPVPAGSHISDCAASRQHELSNRRDGATQPARHRPPRRAAAHPFMAQWPDPHPPRLTRSGSPPALPCPASSLATQQPPPGPNPNPNHNPNPACARRFRALSSGSTTMRGCTPALPVVPEPGCWGRWSRTSRMSASSTC